MNEEEAKEKIAQSQAMEEDLSKDVKPKHRAEKDLGRKVTKLDNGDFEVKITIETTYVLDAINYLRYLDKYRRDILELQSMISDATIVKTREQIKEVESLMKDFSAFKKEAEQSLSDAAKDEALSTFKTNVQAFLDIGRLDNINQAHHLEKSLKDEEYSKLFDEKQLKKLKQMISAQKRK